LLTEVAQAAPPAWRATIDRLLRLDAHTRAYGSLLWQHLTGLPYLDARSDLDLLWERRIGGLTNLLLEEIADIARDAPMTIDGEIIAPPDKAVHWQELRRGAEPLLVKQWDRVLLMSRDSFLQ
jgi:phosphoribosyl-dephospho-CoA transferase